MFTEKFEELKGYLIRNGKFSYKRRNNFLPFTTNKNQRVTFENGMYPIIGALSRLLCGKDVKSVGKLNVAENVLNNENFEVDSGDEFYANRLINEYLGGDKLNILHPKLFLYLPLDDDERANSEIKFAYFIKSQFCDNISFDEFFNVNDSNFNSNILVEFIVENLGDLSDGEYVSEFVTPEPMKEIIEVFHEDIQFLLLNHKDYLTKNFDNLLAFYLYFYFIQFTLKSALNSESKELKKTYYLLDWENISKNRSSVKLGYNRVNDYLKSLLIRVDAIEHLNFVFETEGLLPYELFSYYERLDDSLKSEFIVSFQSWIKYVRSEENLDEIELSDDFKQLFSEYLETISDSYSLNKSRHGTVSRYKLTIEDLGKKYFLKRRGRYGYMFNITQGMLIFVTSLCIKEDKIRITQLFEEYEHRGLFFDRDSRESILELFNKLNLIDKKSDSGDIQYVKSIL